MDDHGTCRNGMKKEFEALLVGGLEHFLFSPIVGMMIQSDFLMEIKILRQRRAENFAGWPGGSFVISRQAGT